jgi:hypothetical protein
MKKTWFVSLALAGLFVLSAARCAAATLIENFSADPLQNGWRIFGDTNLFLWNSTSQNLAVTWDSTQPNSYFYFPLGKTLTKSNSFCLQFDLTLADASAVGYFELAIGLCNFADATGTNFSRANGISPNLFEFDYFPDGPESYGPSIDATLVDANSHFYFVFDATQPMADGVTYRILLIHHTGTSTVSGVVTTNGQVFTTLPNIYAGGVDDFRLDALSINNYTTTDDPYGDSLLAHGTVNHLAFASPLPVETIKTIAGLVEFASDTNWLYTLEESVDFTNWVAAAPAVFGNGTNLVLRATNLPSDKSFYRVRAELP